VLTAEEFVAAILEMRDNKKAIDGGDPTTRYDGVNPSTFGKVHAGAIISIRPPLPMTLT